MLILGPIRQFNKCLSTIMILMSIRKLHRAMAKIMRRGKGLTAQMG
jgi:hypothetical protein